MIMGIFLRTCLSENIIILLSHLIYSAGYRTLDLDNFFLGFFKGTLPFSSSIRCCISPMPDSSSFACDLSYLLRQFWYLYPCNAYSPGWRACPGDYFYSLLEVVARPFLLGDVCPSVLGNQSVLLFDSFRLSIFSLLELLLIKCWTSWIDLIFFFPYYSILCMRVILSGRLSGFIF